MTNPSVTLLTGTEYNEKSNEFEIIASVVWKDKGEKTMATNRAEELMMQEYV